MTPEQRLDRIERIAKLFVRAGLREGRNRQDLNEKIDIIINCQIQNEERFAKNEERFAKLNETVNQLAEAQSGTDRRLNSLIELIARDRNGKSH